MEVTTDMLTYSEAAQMMKTARSTYASWEKRRKLRPNTYLYERDGDYVVKYHRTEIVWIHADGTYTLNTGGWETFTTKERLNYFGPASIYSDKGTWYIWHKSDPLTPPKMQKCRKCHGKGKVWELARYRYWNYYTDSDGHYKCDKIDPPELISPAQEVACYNCSGTGQCDYGSKPRPFVYFDGVTVDSDGVVIDKLAERRYPTEAEIKAKARRQAKALRDAQKRAREEFFGVYGLPVVDGKVTVYKAVNADLMSDHGTHYPIGGLATAPDWSPTPYCGQGLHFSPRPLMAKNYSSLSYPRYLACEIKVKDMVIIDDKVKAPSCKVLFECDSHGAPLALESTTNPE